MSGMETGALEAAGKSREASPWAVAGAVANPHAGPQEGEGISASAPDASCPPPLSIRSYRDEAPAWQLACLSLKGSSSNPNCVVTGTRSCPYPAPPAIYPKLRRWAERTLETLSKLGRDACPLTGLSLAMAELPSSTLRPCGAWASHGSIFPPL